MTTPTEELDAQMEELAAEGITTASQFAAYLNAKNTSSSGLFKLVEDADHWARSDAHTARDLAMLLDMSSFSDSYKDRNHFRPRNWTYDDAMRWMETTFAHPEEPLSDQTPDDYDPVWTDSLPSVEITQDCDFDFV